MTTSNTKNLQKAIAHSPNNKGENHYLDEHLITVGRLAAEFLKVLKVEQLAYYTGIWHDLGKYAPKWQKALEKAISYEEKTGQRLRSLGVPHALHGAKLASERSCIAALCIAGHHSGLPNRTDFKSKIQQELSDFQQSLAEAKKDFSDNLTVCQQLEPKFTDKQQRDLITRMVFSALIDADRLDTVAHAQGIPYKPVQYPSMTELRERFDIARLKEIAKSKASNEVKQVREEIYNYCVKAGAQSRGVFKLCAPTGGGKTFGLQGFALNHAVTHNLQRIIYAAPFTTIIEQTASIYRSMFGAEVVLEHHSAVKEEDDISDDMSIARLAVQNWDSPIIVTTTVQLLESLFSNHPSKCRKVHNIASSIVVIDEVQALPTHLISPILSMLQNLVDHAGCSILLCTATQPAYEVIKIDNYEPIDVIPQEVIKHHFTQLKRVQYLLGASSWTWADIKADIERRNLQQVLVVTNTTADARIGFQEIKLLFGEDCYHLSSRMYPKHRLRVLKAVQAALLEKNKQCCLISTQIIEAGVDLDFNDGYRVIAPLDSIVQSAGRINRNGKLDRLGTMTVFSLAGGEYPSGDYKNSARLAQQIIDQGNDLNNPSTFYDYFRQRFTNKTFDREQIQYFREEMQFQTVSDKFKLIDDAETESVFVAAEPEAEQILAQLEKKGFMTLIDFRKAQDYMVRIPAAMLEKRKLNWYESVAGLRIWSARFYNLEYGIE